MVCHPFLKKKIHHCGFEDLNTCEAIDSKIECIKMKLSCFIPLGQNFIIFIEM